MPDNPTPADRFLSEIEGDIRPNRAELVYGGVALVAALLLLILIPSQTVYKQEWALSKQPALFCAVSILGMVVFGILEVVANWPALRMADAKPAGPEMRIWWRSLEFAGWFMAYVMVVPLLGYLPTTIAFCVGLTWRLGYRSRKMLGAAVGVALFTVVVFKSLLAVKIPAGLWYEWLPDSAATFLMVYF